MPAMGVHATANTAPPCRHKLRTEAETKHEEPSHTIKTARAERDVWPSIGRRDHLHGLEPRRATRRERKIERKKGDQGHTRHGDDGVGDLVAEVLLRGLLHLGQHHGGDLLRGQDLLANVGGHDNVGLVVLVDELERQVLAVLLDRLVVPLAAWIDNGEEEGRPW